MRNNILLCILILLMGVVLGVMGTKKTTQTKAHICVDASHEICDGSCECDGLGCKTSQNMLSTYQVVPIRDYQIEIIEDSLLIYDGKRYVGTIAFGNGGNSWKMSPIDSLIERDNE